MGDAVLDFVNGVSNASDLPTLIKVGADLCPAVVGMDACALHFSGRSAAHNMPAGFGALIHDLTQQRWDADAESSARFLVMNWFETPTDKSLRRITGEARKAGLNTTLTVPVVYRKFYLGEITVGSRAAHTWQPDEITRLVAMGEQIGSAFVRLNLFQDIHDHDRRMTLYNEITRAALGTSDELVVYKIVATRVRELLSADQCFITRWDEQSRITIPTVSDGLNTDGFVRQASPAGTATLTSIVLDSGQPVIVTDFEKRKDLYYASMLRRFSTRSVMALPIIADGQKFGAIIIGFNRVHHFNEEEQALAMQAASQFSLVMSKTRAVNDARRRAQESENLRRAMSELTSLDDLDIVLNRILLYLREVVPLDSSTLFLMENGRLVARAVYGAAHPEKVIGQMLPDTDQFYQIIQQTLHPVILEDAQNDPRFIHWGGSFHVRSWMGVPLMLGGKTIGMLTIDHRKPGIYRQENAELAQAFTSQAALAVHNARLYAAERMRAHALEALNEATTALVSTLEIKELLNRILAAAISAISTSSRGMLILMDPDSQQLKIRAIYGFSDPFIHEDVVIPQNQYLSQAFYQGKPLIIPELDLSPDELINHSHNNKLDELSSAIVAPLMNEDVTVGAISLYSQRKDAFDDGDLRLLESFASMAASAIHNAQLHAEVQRISITDPLTGVFNRRGLIEFGLHEVERTKRFNRRFSAIMFDIDRFKRVNDTYGHVLGDRVLASLAGVSSATLRDADLLGRFGGEEFVALLPETGLEGARDVAERLRKRVEEMRVSSREGDVSITISLGVVEMTPQIKSLDELLSLADYALYRAKEAGRNCVVAWTDED